MNEIGNSEENYDVRYTSIRDGEDMFRMIRSVNHRLETAPDTWSYLLANTSPK